MPETKTRLDAEIQRRERYLEAVVEMQRRLLLTAGDTLGALNHVLEPLGVAAGASRVYLFENGTNAGQLVMNQRAEWCAPGVAPEIDNPTLQQLPYDDFFPRWAAEMRAGRAVQGIVTEFPSSEREILEPQGIRSIVVIPFRVDGAFTGFVGFDNCVEARAWDPLEVSLLGAAATNLGLVLDQRRTQRQLVEARDRAVEASRAKGVFLAKISHELRTPLNAILGYTEILLDDAEGPAEERHRDLGRILASGRHLLTVIDDLLDLSRAEAGKLTLFPRTIALDPLLEDLAHQVRPLARRNRNRFGLDVAGPLGALRADETRLRQILLNLLSNAFKYTADGEVVLRARPEADAVRFEVADTGIGMSPADLERVFDAFTQADDSATRSFEGTGLGLTITKHLVELMGAAMQVTSARGAGSTFVVTVPRG